MRFGLKSPMIVWQGVLILAVSVLGGCLSSPDHERGVIPTVAKPALSNISWDEAEGILTRAFKAIDGRKVALGLVNAAETQYTATHLKKDQFGLVTCRFLQSNAGVPVLDYEYLVQFDSSGKVKQSYGRYLPAAARTPISPKVSSAAIVESSEAQAKRTWPDSSGINVSEPRLVIWTISPEAPLLAYETTVRADVRGTRYYFNAQTGGLIGERTLTYTEMQ